MTPVEAYEMNASGIDHQNQVVMSEISEVYYIAARIRERLPQHVPMEDLVSAGVLGLLEAFRKFDGSKNVQFKTFARFRISGAIIDSLRDLDWVPRSLRRKGREVEAAMVKLQTALGRYPTEEEIAKELHVSTEELAKLFTRLDSASMVGQQVVTAGDDADVHDLIESAAANEDENPFEQYQTKERREHLARAIAQLSEREQLLLSLYYQEELTMKEIAAVLSVGESRVSQMHSMALAKLKAYLSQAAGTTKVGRLA